MFCHIITPSQISISYTKIQPYRYRLHGSPPSSENLTRHHPQLHTPAPSFFLPRTSFTSSLIISVSLTLLSCSHCLHSVSCFMDTNPNCSTTSKPCSPQPPHWQSRKQTRSPTEPRELLCFLLIYQFPSHFGAANVNFTYTKTQPASQPRQTLNQTQGMQHHRQIQHY